MKDSLLNLVLFLLVFLGSAVLFLATYGVALVLVPEGRGLVFSSPYAAALWPSLLVALVVALYRSSRRPGQFSVTWSLLGSAFFLIVTLSLPVIQQMPPVRAADSNPAITGRFLPLEDGSLLLSKGQSSLLVPPPGAAMSVSSQTQYDPLNRRFVFSNDAPRALGSTGPEQAYFEYTPELAALQRDFLALTKVLRDSSNAEPLLFWFQAAMITWLFLGLYFFFSLKTWPLVHVVLVLSLMRLSVVFLVYAFLSVPALIDLWVPSPFAAWARSWGPVIFVGSAASTLFFMTWLSKPHLQRGRL